jgi:hypothetical protein
VTYYYFGLWRDDGTDDEAPRKSPGLLGESPHLVP